MPRLPKRSRSDDEVAILAARLGLGWQTGDGIETWLRQHVEELTAMVRDQGWTWDDIGRALNVAGIQYQTGRPWRAVILRKKAGIARARLNQNRTPTDAVAVAVRDALIGLGGKVGQIVINMPGPNVQADPTPTQPARPSSGASHPPALPDAADQSGAIARPHDQEPTDEEAEDAPTFAPASIIGWTGPKPVPSAPTGPKATPPAPAAKQDADEVMKRFLGKRTV